MSETDEQKDKVTSFYLETKPACTTHPVEYGRQLSERKRLEEAKLHEDRLLRRSLRQSERLRQLARAKKVAKDLRISQRSKDNLGFDEEECDIRPDHVDMGAFIRDLRRTMGGRSGSEPSSDIDDLSDVEWDWLAKRVSNRTVTQQFNLHDFIAKTLERTRENLNDLPREAWPVEKDTLVAISSVIRSANELPISCRTQEVDEFLQIITSPEMKALFVAHDAIANIWASEALKSKKQKQRKADPTSSLRGAIDSGTLKPGRTAPTGPRERTVFTSPVGGCYKILAVDDQGNTVSTTDGTTLVNVILQKGDAEFFGGTVRNEGSAIVIGRIISGGLLEKTGLLNEGDELLSVNGVNLVGKDVDHVSHILTRIATGQIDLLVAPVLPITEAALYSDEPVAHLRALYSYEPSNDMYNPCREASILFDKGDILRILSTRDPNWWQALRIEEEGAVGVSGGMAGLVPSPYFQRYRSVIRLRRGGGLEEDAAAGYSESEESDYELDAAPPTEANAGSSRSSRSPHRHRATNSPTSHHSRSRSPHRGAYPPSSLSPGATTHAADPIWSAHGIGPKQLRKQLLKKSRISKIRHIFATSGSSLLHSRKYATKKGNEYELSMELSTFSQGDGDQLRQLVEESVRDSIRRPSLLTYELVDLYYPQPQRRRPLVLVGPTHVGRQQLIEGLLKCDEKRFSLPDIHTTNPDVKSSEFQHYQKITKEDFQGLQRGKAFIEWGVYGDHFYGTKASSIESIIKAGKVCVIALRPDSIRAIRRTSFLPCVIFVSPPDNLEDLRKLRTNLGRNLDFSDEELKCCIDESQKMEQHYGHFFEFLLMPRSRETAVNELHQIALSLERRPQWVPAHWIDLAWQVAARAVRENAAERPTTDDNNDIIVDSNRMQ